MWLYGYVVARWWLCGYVAMWLSGYVAKGLCGSVVPLNIPIPTLAPDRGGPVACLGGLVLVIPIVLNRLINAH